MRTLDKSHFPRSGGHSHSPTPPTGHSRSVDRGLVTATKRELTPGSLLRALRPPTSTAYVARLSDSMPAPWPPMASDDATATRHRTAHRARSAPSSTRPTRTRTAAPRPAERHPAAGVFFCPADTYTPQVVLLSLARNQKCELRCHEQTEAAQPLRESTLSSRRRTRFSSFVALRSSSASTRASSAVTDASRTVISARATCCPPRAATMASST